MDIVHDEKRRAFVIDAPEGEAYMTYERDGDKVNFTHTFVPKELGGRGIAGKIADAAYGWARKEGLDIRADCSYMDAWLKKNV